MQHVAQTNEIDIEELCNKVHKQGAFLVKIRG